VLKLNAIILVKSVLQASSTGVCLVKKQEIYYHIPMNVFAKITKSMKEYQNVKILMRLNKFFKLASKLPNQQLKR